MCVCHLHVSVNVIYVKVEVTCYSISKELLPHFATIRYEETALSKIHRVTAHKDLPPEPRGDESGHGRPSVIRRGRQEGDEHRLLVICEPLDCP